MILQMIRGSYTWQFNVENGGYSGATVYVTGAINWGEPPITRITQRGPFQNGDTDIDYRLNPRVINLPIVVPGSQYDEMMNNREKLMQMFKPGNDTIILEHVLNETSAPAFQTRRRIELKIAGGLQMDTLPGEFNIRTVVQLRAADPTWYDANQKTLQLTNTIFGTPTPYPKPYGVPYGSSTIDNFQTVAYYGTVLTRPVIQVYGPVTNLFVVDSLGHQINLTQPVPNGDIWTIDLRDGYKTIVDQNGANQFSALSIDSDIINWGIFPEPIVPYGANTISVGGTGTSGITAVYALYYDRYAGI
jgi:hypothetical protein